MGTIKQGILGGFSGRVGTVVGSSWKTVHYMRALATNISDPHTEKQQHQRSKFATAISFVKAMTPFLRIGYKEYSQQQSAFNAAMSYTLRYALKGSATDISIDYNKALVTRGSLMPVFNATVAVADNKAAFAWTDNSGSGDATGEDEVMLLAYNKDRALAVYTLATATRSAAKAELALPTDWSDNALAIYLGFRGADGRSVSNSVCLQDTPASGGAGDSGSDGDGDQSGNPLG